MQVIVEVKHAQIECAWTELKSDISGGGSPSQQDQLQEFDAAIFGYIIVYSAGNKIQLGLKWLMQTTIPNIVYFNLGKK